MKVRARVKLYEGGRKINIGEVFEVDEARAKALGKSIEIIEEEKKEKEGEKEKESKKGKKKVVKGKTKGVE